MKVFTVFSILLAATIGCNPSARTTTQTQVSGSLLAFSDFDLETVVGVVKENKVNGAEELEKFINSDNGINNVDVDKDGKVDYLKVVEGRDGQTIVLDVVATPSDGGDEVTVANLRFTQNTTTEEIVVEGGYPSYVSGYNNHYYSYRQPGLSIGQAMFLMWAFTPNRSYYHYARPVYMPRPVLTGSSLTSRRTATRTTTKVGPVKSTARPSSYSVKSAQKTQSKLKSKGVSSFKKRDATKPKQRATGFGKSTPSNKKSTVKPTPKRKTGWGSSKPSRSRSRGWGRSSGGRRRSSERYKTEIQNFETGLNVINKLQPVTWKWSNDTDAKMPLVGLIAEDVAKIMPEAVYYNEAGEIEGIDYSLIIIPLVNAVQDLNNRCQ